MKKKIIVLGAGLVGNAIAADLVKDHSVSSADINESALRTIKNAGVEPIQADISNSARLKEIIAPFDIVVGAVPGFMGFRTVQAVIEAGKNIVDISFFPEDPFALHDLAVKAGVTVVTDCGVAPGLGNIILGYHNKRMQVKDYECLVGGLPVVREWPFEYKAVFSPIDVIEEYTRPARYVQNHQVVVREALSDPELVNFDEVGTLESWNSDGLRTLIRTMPGIPNMIEKTLRYPNSIALLRALRASGFFSYDEIEINGAMIRPIDLTARLLFPKWKLKAGEQEFTIMRIRISGTINDEQKKIQYDLFDRTDAATGTLSMARTTGYTCNAAVNLVLKGQYSRKGISPPEYLGEDEADFRFILNYLKERRVIVRN